VSSVTADQVRNAGLTTPRPSQCTWSQSDQDLRRAYNARNPQIPYTILLSVNTPPLFLSERSEPKDLGAAANGALRCASAESLSAAVTLGSFDYAQDDDSGSKIAGRSPQ